MPPQYRASAAESHRRSSLKTSRRRGRTRRDLLSFSARPVGACVDGACFGAYGEGYVRFSYANSFEKLMDAVDRIKKFVASR